MRNKVTIIYLTNRHPRKSYFPVVLLCFPVCYIYLLLLILTLGSIGLHRATSSHHTGDDLNLLFQNYCSWIIAMIWIRFRIKMPGSCLAQFFWEELFSFRFVLFIDLNDFASILFGFKYFHCVSLFWLILPTFSMKIYNMSDTTISLQKCQGLVCPWSMTSMMIFF